MRDFEAVMPLYLLLGAALTKFARIERKPVDFGIGLPLHPAEVHMLATLAALDGGVTDVAAACGVTKGAVSQMVTRLEDKGLVSREPAGARTRLVLTALGHQANQAHATFHREHDREFLEYLRSLPERDFATCLELGRQMKAWMGNYPE
ncbi:MarR family winged helix-turn-helix transcriptional regulator [Solidesulfovibrio sp.]